MSTKLVDELCFVHFGRSNQGYQYSFAALALCLSNGRRCIRFYFKSQSQLQNACYSSFRDGHAPLNGSSIEFTRYYNMTRGSPTLLNSTYYLKRFNWENVQAEHIGLLQPDTHLCRFPRGTALCFGSRASFLDIQGLPYVPAYPELST
ncbi:hypothetical protein J6590_094040 [Homalodisca vitripennis]|nr:hypothetical protein J6590_094040 [Homalodisca vitripennis]